MGLFDDLTKNLDLGEIAQKLSSNPKLMQAAASLLSPQEGSVGGSGGLEDVLGKLASSGLGDQVSSWLSSGGNKPVRGDQIASALGGDTLAEFAAKAGIDVNVAGTALAGVLPGLIDMLSPQGKAPSGDTLNSLLARLG